MTAPKNTCLTTNDNSRTCLFKSPAQIMVRQEIGWAPMGVGGLSHVLITQKRHKLGFDYNIEAFRMSGDEKIVLLECKVDYNTNFHRINPTFHSWTTENGDKFGLTFDTFDAAEKFERLFSQILRKVNRGSTKSDCADTRRGESSNALQYTSSTNSSKCADVKLWGSCQHINSNILPSSMKCFQSPEQFHNMIQNECVVPIPPQPHVSSQAASIPPLIPPTSTTISQIDEQINPIRHSRSASASSAPCLLRINGMTNVNMQMNPLNLHSTTSHVHNQVDAAPQNAGAQMDSCIRNLFHCFQCCSIGQQQHEQQDPVATQRQISQEGASSSSMMNTNNNNNSSSNMMTSTQIYGPESADHMTMLDLVLSWQHQHQHTSTSTSIITSATGTGTITNPTTTATSTNLAPTLYIKPAILTCIYCRRKFRPTRNPPGSCELAPDRVRSLIDCFTLKPLSIRLYRCLVSCFTGRQHHSVRRNTRQYHQQHQFMTGVGRRRHSQSFRYNVCGSGLSGGICGDGDDGDDVSQTLPGICDCFTITRNDGSVSTGVAANGDNDANKPNKMEDRNMNRCETCCFTTLLYSLLPCICCQRPCVAGYESCVDRGLLGGRHSVDVRFHPAAAAAASSISTNQTIQCRSTTSTYLCCISSEINTSKTNFINTTNATSAIKRSKYRRSPSSSSSSMLHHHHHHPQHQHQLHHHYQHHRYYN